MQISKVIKAHGHTIQDVADKLGITRGTLAQMIASTANPTIGTLRKIADAIGCSVVEFFADEESSTAHEQNAVPGPSAILVCPHCGKSLSIHVD